MAFDGTEKVMPREVLRRKIWCCRTCSRLIGAAFPNNTPTAAVYCLVSDVPERMAGLSASVSVAIGLAHAQALCGSASSSALWLA